MRQDKYEYDAFISHAVEDKIPIANELCARLEQAGLKIWYSGKELGVGDSIEKTIEKGLYRSRYGIVIFSPTYLAKNWTIREFYTLLSKEIEEQKVILPVLYNVTLDDLKNKDLLMADRFAVNADRGMDFVVERLVREIRKSKVVKEKVAWFSRIWLVLIVSLLANIALLVKGMNQSEPPTDHYPVAARSVDPHLFSPTIFGEMQGMVREFNNACTCQRDRHSPMPDAGKPRLVRTTHAGYGGQEREANAAPHDARKQGGKMTMAIVFQIETSPDVQRDLETEMEEVLETVTLTERQNSLIAISDDDNNIEHSLRECAHSSHFAE